MRIYIFFLSISFRIFGLLFIVKKENYIYIIRVSSKKKTKCVNIVPEINNFY